MYVLIVTAFFSASGDPNQRTIAMTSIDNIKTEAGCEQMLRDIEGGVLGGAGHLTYGVACLHKE